MTFQWNSTLKRNTLQQRWGDFLRLSTGGICSSCIERVKRGRAKVTFRFFSDVSCHLCVRELMNGN